MSLYKKILGMVLASTIAITSAFAVVPVAAVEYNLPPDIEIKKNSFDSLEALTEKYTTTFVTQVNNQEERIQAIAFEEGYGEVNGTIVIDIPEELARVMHFFTRVDIVGTAIKGFEVNVKTPAKENSLSEPWRGDNHIQGRTTSFAIDTTDLDNAYKGWTMTITGTGTISKLQFFEANGLPVSYDITAWTVLGGDRPILDAKVSLDPTKRLSIEGITEYENEKFKTLYANPLGEPDGYVVAEEFVDLDFNPGRQMHKFGPAFETAYGSATAPKMVEDANREGYGDYSFFENNYQRSEADIKIFDGLYAEDLKWTLCYDDWPSWNWRENPSTADGNRGTPDIKYFDAAADLAAEYTVAYQQKVGGRGPTWVEVKNESTITHEWGFHDDMSANNESWRILADFHNIVADKIRAASPETLVGGPTAAWMALDANDFAEARKHMLFLDETKGNMDFYSYHFYEAKDLVINDMETNCETYLTGRLEADLDLLRNHMHITDNVTPLLISETGSLHSGPTDPDLFIKIKNFNSYTVRYMNRANEFEQVVPFLLPITWWSKDDPDHLMDYDSNGNPGELTKMMDYVNLWAPYNGKLIPAFSDNADLTVHSAQDGDVIYVVLNNLNNQRTSIDLDLNLAGSNVTAVERTRSYLELGEMKFETEKLDGLNDILVGVEETSIVKITLDEVPEVTNTLYKETFYGDKTLQPTGSAANFTVKTPTADVEKSVLRVSFGRNGGFTEDMTVTINDQTFNADLGYSNKTGRFFEYLDFEVPTSSLKDSNAVSVNIPQEGGQISTVAIINHSTKAAPTDEALVNKTASSIMVDGSVVSKIESYNLDGINYVALDDLARALGETGKSFDLTWNEGNDCAEILTGQALTHRVRDNIISGGDMRYADPEVEKVFVDGSELATSGFSIQNEEFYNLRDLCKAININVGWDEASNSINLISSEDYSS